MRHQPTGRANPIALFFWVIVLPMTVLAAENKKTLQMKNFLKEVKELYQDLEIVDIQEPPVQVFAGQVPLPSFRLRNKTHAALSAPPGFSPQNAGGTAAWGYPVWRFTPVDAKLPRFPVLIHGVSVGGAKVEADGCLEIGSENQPKMVTDDRRLLPGSYKLSVEFHAVTEGQNIGAPGTLPAVLSAKSFKVIIQEKPTVAAPSAPRHKTSAASVPAKGTAADHVDPVRLKNDAFNRGKSALVDALFPDDLVLASNTIRPGVPLGYSFTLNLNPGSNLPATAGKTQQLAYRVGVVNSGSAAGRTYVASYNGSLPKSALAELAEKRTCLVGSVMSIEVNQLEPGTYELEILVLEDGIRMLPGTKNSLSAPFRVVR